MDPDLQDTLYRLAAHFGTIISETIKGNLC